MTTVTESLDSKPRDEIKSPTGSLRVVQCWDACIGDPLGTDGDEVQFRRTAAKNIERRLQTRQSLQVEVWQSPFTTRAFGSPAPQLSEQSNDQHSVLPGAY